MCDVNTRGEQYLLEPLYIEMETIDSEQLALMPDFVDFLGNERVVSLKLLTVAFMDPALLFLGASVWQLGPLHQATR